MCFELAGCLVPRDVLLPFRITVACTEWRVQRTLPFGPYFLWTKFIVGHRGGGGGTETPVVFICSMEECAGGDSDSTPDTATAWVMTARGVWVLGHSFGNGFHFVRGISEDKGAKRPNGPVSAEPHAQTAKPSPKGAITWRLFPRR